MDGGFGVMARYPNGKIPKSVLVHLGGDHWLTPATKARWGALVEDVLRNEGVRLQITPGPNAYRDIGWQQHYWDTLPYPQASFPGGSSHGGDYKGRDSMAIDVGNWGLLGKAKFYTYARKHGFEPDFFDWEPWHIIDWSPWAMPAGGIEDELSEKAERQIQVLYDAWRIGEVGKRTDGNGTARIKLMQAQLAQVLEKVGAIGGVTTEFYKHGDMPEGSNLWIFVLPNGDFVRIRDNETAALYKEMNGGFQSQVLSKAAIRQLRDDLKNAGGKDLSAVSGSTDTVGTTAQQDVSDFPNETAPEDMNS